jgi:REP element-mobilizing transposase RayT
MMGFDETPFQRSRNDTHAAGMETACKPGHHNLRKGRASLPGQLYLVTTATFERAPLFADFAIAHIAARAIVTPQPVCSLLCWVLMPDHLHALVEIRGGRLSDAVQRIKERSSRAVNEARGVRGSVWSAAFHDHALRREDDVIDIARYIVCNPLRAGLVRSVRDYAFWDAIWLEG